MGSELRCSLFLKEKVFMRSLFLFLVAIGCYSSYGQEALSFDEPNFNFGEISEQDGPVDHTFTFVNNSPDSIRILGVRASCGCTTPAWTKDVIAPGASGSITARYNPLNRPGAFRKSLTVSTNVPSIRPILYINGSVKPRPRTVEDDLPTLVDGLRFKYLSFNFGKIKTKEAITKTFEVYNNTDEPVTLINDRSKMPGHISVALSPEILQPKTRGKILATFDPTADVELGFQSTNIQLLTSDASKPKSLTVLATVEEYFKPLSLEELEEAPKLSFDMTSHNFGKLEKDATVETEFTLTNEGKTDLNLRKVATNCACTIASVDKMDVSPGEQVKMKVKFDTAGRRGRQYKSISVFSNDPTAPTQVITIRAEVPR